MNADGDRLLLLAQHPRSDPASCYAAAGFAGPDAKRFLFPVQWRPSAQASDDDPMRSAEVTWGSQSTRSRHGRHPALRDLASQSSRTPAFTCFARFNLEGNLPFSGRYSTTDSIATPKQVNPRGGRLLDIWPSSIRRMRAGLAHKVPPLKDQTLSSLRQHNGSDQPPKADGTAL